MNFYTTYFHAFIFFCATIIFSTIPNQDNKIIFDSPHTVEKCFPDTEQLWPESPVPQPLGRARGGGAKKRGGKGKR